ERGAGRMEVGAAGVGRDLPERLLVEPRLHDLTLPVLDEAALDADELALRGPYADGVDPDTAVGGALGRLLHLALVVLAVRDEDERLVLPLPALEGLERRVDRPGQRGATSRDDTHLERIEALAEGAVVEGQRALHEGGAREGDEPDAIATELADEV